MRRAPIPTTVLLSASLLLFAGNAAAQDAAASAGETRGLRYLSWSSRSEATPARAEAGTTSSAPARRDLRRPNTVIPHGGFAGATAAPARTGLTPAPGARRSLTPANAWLHPVAPPPEPAVSAAARPAPTPFPTPFPTPSPAAVTAPGTVVQPRMSPDYLPDPAGRGQALPADLITAPAPVQSSPLDPMAPRRDAPIFRMQQDAPTAAPTPGVPSATGSAEMAAHRLPVAEAVNSGQRPPQQGGRYYSVHRQNGRRPDALEIPEPTYVDALAIALPETIASQDLAVPEPGPALIRDAQGRVRPAPASSDGDHQ